MRALSGHCRASRAQAGKQRSPPPAACRSLRRDAVLAVDDDAQRLAQILFRIKRLGIGAQLRQRTVTAPDRPPARWRCWSGWHGSGRRRCTSRRACGEVIHWLSPLAIAVRPSSEAPSFSYRGRLVRIRFRKPLFSASASFIISPWLTLNAGLLQAAGNSRPATCGFGSRHRGDHAVDAPAAISASQHGGVRPWWPQGSRVIVGGGAARLFASHAQGVTSACGSPAR